MSLQLAAQRLAAQGRGGDTTLVHMNPKEVAGLQALALRGGTSLTINPQTGLPEALKLKDLLPAALGFALGPAGFGLMSSFGAAATVGGLTALTSGSLSKGLMAGMGAYGGASLGEGLMGAGIGAAQDTAMAGLGEGASQAARNEAAAAATREFAAKGAMERLGSGLSASAANPSSLVSSLGGGSKALQAGYMLAAPIMADQAVQTTTKAPALDTGYIRPYTGWDPNTLSFRAEKPIKASEVRLSDGGSTSLRTSQEALDYLMGKTPPRKANPVIVQGFNGPNEITGKGGKYVYDSATGTYKFVADTTQSTATGSTVNPYGGGYVGGYGDSAPGPDTTGEGPTGVSATSSPGFAGSIANGLGLAIAVAQNALGLTPSQSPASVVDVNDATNSSSSKDSADQAGSGPTATGGPSGTGAAASAAGHAAADAAAAAGHGPAAQGAAGQAAADAILGGASPAAAAQLGADAAASASGGTTGPGSATGIGVGSSTGINAMDAQSDAAASTSGTTSLGDLGGLALGGPDAAASTSGTTSLGDLGGLALGGPDAGTGGGGVGAGNDGGGIGAGEGLAKGGLFKLARGGMQSNAFVVPADVVSALGNGSTKAGLSALNAQLSKMAGGGATLIQGPGDGLSDSISTNIDGRKRARVADGEAYISPQVVQRLGGGSVDKGSAKLYKMMDKIRQQAHGKKTQQRPVKADRVLA